MLNKYRPALSPDFGGLWRPPPTCFLVIPPNAIFTFVRSIRELELWKGQFELRVCPALSSHHL